MYDNRSKNFLRNSTFALDRGVMLITALDIDGKSIFEFKVKQGWVYLTAWDYILPTTKGKGTSLNFDFFHVFLGRGAIIM